MDRLVNSLKHYNMIKSEEVARTMLKLDRARFSLLNPYADSPQPLGNDVTISAPHMHASALEECRKAILDIKTPRILDIGSGSGYLTIAFYLLMLEMNKHSGSSVWGVEKIDRLVKMSRSVVEEIGVPVEIIAGDGKLGLPKHGPYDFIHVGASIQDPKIKNVLSKQLSIGGGVLLAPLFDRWTIVKRVSDDEYEETFLMDVRFVNLK